MNPLNPFANLRREKGTWDMGVEYELARPEMERRLRTEQRKSTYANWATLLIQLVNGSRISEAVDAWNEFLTTGARDLQVRLRKRWKRDKETNQTITIIEYRKMVIPPQIEQKGTHRTAGAVKVFVHRRGANTHSLRYALVSHMSKQGVTPQIIAKITHHKKLDMILKYTQQQVADDLLKQEANRPPKPEHTP